MDPSMDEILNGEIENIDNITSSVSEEGIEGDVSVPEASGTAVTQSDEVGIDDVLAMSEEEIDALLSARKSDQESDTSIFAPEAGNFDDLMNSMGDASEKGDIGEINDLFRKEQEEIPVDPQIERLLNNLDNDKLDFEDYSPEDLFENTTPQSPGNKKEKSGGLFSKLFAKKEKADKNKEKSTKKDSKVAKGREEKDKRVEDKEEKKKEKNRKKIKNKEEKSSKDKKNPKANSSKNKKNVQNETEKEIDSLAAINEVEAGSSDFNLQDVDDFSIDDLDNLTEGARQVEDGEIQYSAADLFDHQENENAADPVVANVDMQESSSLGTLSTDTIQEFDAAELDQLLEIRDKDAEVKDPASVDGEKKGLLAKIKEFLTDDEEEVEEETPKKEKKSKKDKGNKKKGADSEDDEEGSSEKDAKKKKEKKPKVKKAKAPKEEDTNAKKYPVKKMLLILFVFLVFGCGFSLIAYLYMGFSTKQKAVAAYEQGDYAVCYQNLYGQRLTESQEILFHKSETNLKMDLAKKNYKKYKTSGEFLKALDHIVQFFYRYDDEVAQARQWNCAEVVQSTRDELEDAMYEDFGITIGQAKEIANMESDYDYTRALMNIVDGIIPSVSDHNSSGSQNPDGQDEHVIPEEQDRVDAPYIEP